MSGPCLSGSFSSRPGLFNPGTFFGSSTAVNPMLGVTADATMTTVYLPQSAAEWTIAMAAAGITSGGPSYLQLLQEASGNPQDSIGGRHLVKGGSFTYQQAVAGWATKSIHTVEGSGGGVFTNGSYPEISTTSVLVLLYAKVTGTPAAESTLMSLHASFGISAAIEVNTTPRLVCNSAGNTATSAASSSGQVRPYVIRINQTLDTVAMFTDAEKIPPAFSGSMNGTIFTLGGDFNSTWYPPATDFMYCATFVGAAAEMTDAQLRTLLTMLGWTVAW